SSEITIPLGIEFDNPEVILLAEQKNRDLVKDLEEEYSYTTNRALNLERKDFEKIQEYEQRILIERFAQQIELCKSELLREQYQAKYRKLLEVSLENLDKMYNVEDEEERMFQEQQRARRQEQTISRTTTRPSLPTSPTFFDKAKE
ncbi:28841_t:CDS:2, partial [Racocetra persica]